MAPCAAHERQPPRRSPSSEVYKPTGFSPRQLTSAQLFSPATCPGDDVHLGTTRSHLPQTLHHTVLPCSSPRAAHLREPAPWHEHPPTFHVTSPGPDVCGQPTAQHHALRPGVPRSRQAPSPMG